MSLIQSGSGAGIYLHPLVIWMKASRWAAVMSSSCPSPPAVKTIFNYQCQPNGGLVLAPASKPLLWLVESRGIIHLQATLGVHNNAQWVVICKGSHWYASSQNKVNIMNDLDTPTHAVSDASLDPFTIVILYPLHPEYQLIWKLKPVETEDLLIYEN